MPDAAEQAATRNPPFFIVGVQRSGTTLLRLMLNAHSRISVPEEARFLMPLLTEKGVSKTFSGRDKDRLVNYLINSRQLANWNFDISEPIAHIRAISKPTVRDVMQALYGQYARSEGKDRWGDKSLFFTRIPQLRRLFPEATFLHVVRDGRDVFLSWRKMDPSMGNPAVMGLDWALKEGHIARSLASVPSSQQLSVRYESLVRDPEQTLQSVCTVLAVEYEPSMLEFHRRSSRYIGAHHSTKIFGKVDATNVEKWRLRLQSGERMRFEAFAGSTLQKHGYPLSTTPGPYVRLRALVGLVGGIPGRAYQILKAKALYRLALATGSSARVEVGEKPQTGDD